jgi:hypothetical protein
MLLHLPSHTRKEKVLVGWEQGQGEGDHYHNDVHDFPFSVLYKSIRINILQSLSFLTFSFSLVSYLLFLTSMGERWSSIQIEPKYAIVFYSNFNVKHTAALLSTTCRRLPGRSLGRGIGMTRRSQMAWLVLFFESSRALLGFERYHAMMSGAPDKILT